MPDENPLVSIIIPTYNRAHLIGETLDSVLAQTYPHWECIVVDDGSTDDTQAVVQAYVQKDPRFQYHHRPPEHLPGGNGARNYGFKVSKGEFVNWFDDDDVMLSEFIEAKLKAFTGNVEFVICECYLTDESLRNKEKVNLTLNTFLFKDYVLWDLKVFTPSVLFKKSFLKDLQFDEKILRGQETEFFSRIFFRINTDIYKIVNIPLFLYRQHPKTKTEDNKNYISSFVKSQSSIAFENLKRAILIEDNTIKAYYFKGLISNFFIALKHRDNKLAVYILDIISRRIKTLSIANFLEFTIFGYFFLYIRLVSIRCNASND